MIDTMIVLLGCFWMLYKSYKKKDVKIVYLVIILLLFQLSQWPLYLPIFVSFGLQSIFAGGLVFYEYYIKLKDRLAVTLSILFVAFGLIFLGQAIPLHNPTVKGVIAKAAEVINR